MFMLTGPHQAEQEIKKSRFLALAFPIASEEEAKALLLAHSDLAATHNCWAWRLGQAYRFNDDGEPSGTAGKPILQAIDGQKLDQTLVLVIRWFGGILLGSGGLMRAYGGCAAQCLREADKSEVILRQVQRISVGFSDLALVKSRLPASALLMEEDFTATGADMTLAVPQAELGPLLVHLTDLTAGRLIIHKMDKV